MYKILGYSGGVYRFDEVLETVEDAGGIVLNRDEFHISRGEYFISQEVHVIIVIPEEGVEDLKSIATELKGDIEDLNVDREQKIAVMSIIPVYNLLCQTSSWVDVKTLEDIIVCPCMIGVCKEFEEFSCCDEMEKTLDSMCRMDIAEYRESDGNKEYRLKKG
jgi:methyl coenzyme M reductase subunit C-like uncharacterized protein (methanogenesis marker protein 7)